MNLSEGHENDESEQLAAHYRSTVARIPDAAERKELADAHAAGLIPRRKLKP